ncbi:MAG: FecR domain-containing protein [Butyrivibrio sp.]|nr:FecR domain-containing protein [Acetatifactor muris]MCM1558380.1 FecR domain-containing protein [Butyrivibrio sp.]
MKKLSKNQKIGVAAAAAVFVAAVVTVIAVFAGKTGESYRSIKIVEMSGEVTIGREGIGELDAAVNMNLVSGDSVHTGKDAYVVLMLDTDKYVMLGEAGSMEVVAEGDEARGRTSILLEQGSVLSEIQNPLGQGSSYDVVTPNATMSVRGTVFEIDRAADGLVSLLVYDGAVALGMDGQEPALYNAGEYMQFEEGNPPKVIVDREPISEEVINEQMRQRLEEINESGRSLNTGNVQLADKDAVPDAADSENVSDSTAAPEPAGTPAPEVTGTPEPESTPEAAETPEPAATKTPEKKPKPTATPEPTPAPTPEPTPAPTPEPWVPPTPSYTVTFANPNVWTGETAGKSLRDLIGQDGEYGYAYRQVEEGQKVTAPKESEFIPNSSDSSVSLKLTGWYLENGTKWDFENNAVTGNVTLYPAWEEVKADVSGGDVSGGDAGGAETKKYWPVIFKGTLWGENGGSGSRCACLPEGTTAMPTTDLSNGSISGWEKVYGTETAATEKMWSAADSVKSVIALKRMETPASTESPAPTETPAATESPSPSPTS